MKNCIYLPLVCCGPGRAQMYSEIMDALPEQEDTHSIHYTHIMYIYTYKQTLTRHRRRKPLVLRLQHQDKSPQVLQNLRKQSPNRLPAFRARRDRSRQGYHGYECKSVWLSVNQLMWRMCKHGRERRWWWWWNM